METQTTEPVAFEQRVDRLAKHLLRAGKGHKAAILFAVYISEITRAAAEALLETRLQEAGETIVRVRVQSEGETVDLPSYLRNHPQNGQAIFFIYDVARGGNATQQYLNYRREFLVEDQQRLLFWLHENEIGQLARNAPDFWAFRGRTLEFLEQPPPQRQAELAWDLAYYNWHGNYTQNQEELKAGIRLREQLLAELPDEPEFAGNRSELLFTLAAQYEMLGDSNKALQLFNQAEKFANLNDNMQLALIYCGRGISYNTLGQSKEALAEWGKAIHLNPEFIQAYYNRGTALAELKEYDKALVDFSKVIELDNDFTAAYVNRGNIYNVQGKFNKAFTDYEKAARLEPEDATLHWNIALLAIQQNKWTEAIQHLKRSIRTDPSKRQILKGHLFFEPLRDDPRFRALVEPDVADEEA